MHNRPVEIKIQKNGPSERETYSIPRGRVPLVGGWVDGRACLGFGGGARTPRA